MASVDKVWETELAESDGVWAVGSNESGQLGTGDQRPRSMPTPILPLFAKRVISVRCAPDGERVIAVTGSGEVYMWGGGSALGDPAAVAVPPAVASRGGDMGGRSIVQHARDAGEPRAKSRRGSLGSSGQAIKGAVATTATTAHGRRRRRRSSTTFASLELAQSIAPSAKSMAHPRPATKAAYLAGEGNEEEDDSDVDVDIGIGLSGSSSSDSDVPALRPRELPKSLAARVKSIRENASAVAALAAEAAKHTGDPDQTADFLQQEETLRQAKRAEKQEGRWRRYVFASLERKALDIDPTTRAAATLQLVKEASKGALRPGEFLTRCKMLTRGRRHPKQNAATFRDFRTKIKEQALVRAQNNLTQAQRASSTMSTGNDEAFSWGNPTMAEEERGGNAVVEAIRREQAAVREALREAQEAQMLQRADAGDSGKRRQKVGLLEKPSEAEDAAEKGSVVGRALQPRKGAVWTRPSRVTAAGLGGAVRAAAACVSNSHALIVSTDGVALAWGRGEQGQCGLGELSVRAETPTLIPALTEHPLTRTSVEDAVASATFSLWLSKTGKLLSSGSALAGRLGVGSNDTGGDGVRRQELLTLASQSYPAPTPVVFAPSEKWTFVRISCGVSHCFAVTDSGMAFSWGEGAGGRTGQGDQLVRWSPHPVPGLEDMVVLDVACGVWHSVVLAQEVAVFDRLHSSVKPRFAERQLDWEMVSSSARKRDGSDNYSAWSLSQLLREGPTTVLTCGSGVDGQLGRGRSDTKALTLRTVSDLPHNVTRIAAGQFMSAFVTASGALYTCGRSVGGCLGRGPRLPERAVEELGAWPGKVSVRDANGHTVSVRDVACGKNFMVLLSWPAGWRRGRRRQLAELHRRLTVRSQVSSQRADKLGLSPAKAASKPRRASVTLRIYGADTETKTEDEAKIIEIDLEEGDDAPTRVRRRSSIVKEARMSAVGVRMAPTPTRKQGSSPITFQELSPEGKDSSPTAARRPFAQQRGASWRAQLEREIQSLARRARVGGDSDASSQSDASTTMEQDDAEVAALERVLGFSREPYEDSTRPASRSLSRTRIVTPHFRSRSRKDQARMDGSRRSVIRSRSAGRDAMNDAVQAVRARSPVGHTVAPRSPAYMGPGGTRVGALAPFGLDLGIAADAEAAGGSAAKMVGFGALDVENKTLAQLTAELAARFPASSAAGRIMGINPPRAAEPKPAVERALARMDEPQAEGKGPAFRSPMASAPAQAPNIALDPAFVTPANQLMTSLRRDLEQRLHLASTQQFPSTEHLGEDPEVKTAAGRAARRRSLFDASAGMALGGRPWTAVTWQADTLEPPPMLTDSLVRDTVNDELTVKLLSRAVALLAETPLSRQLAPLNKPGIANAVLDDPSSKLLSNLTAEHQPSGLSDLAKSTQRSVIPGSMVVLEPNTAATNVLGAVASLMATKGSTARRPLTSAAAAGITVRVRNPDGSQRLAGAGATELFQAKLVVGSDEDGARAQQPTVKIDTSEVGAQFRRYSVKPGVRASMAVKPGGANRLLDPDAELELSDDEDPLQHLTYDDELAEDELRPGVVDDASTGSNATGRLSTGQRARLAASRERARSAEAKRMESSAAGYRRDGASPQRPQRRRDSAYMALKGLVVSKQDDAEWRPGQQPAWWDTGIVDEAAEEEARVQAYTYAMLHPRCSRSKECKGFSAASRDPSQCSDCGYDRKYHDPEIGFQSLLVAMYKRVLFAKNFGHLYERASTPTLKAAALRMQTLWRGYWARCAFYDTILVDSVRKVWHPIARKPFYLRIRGFYRGLGSWAPPSLLRHQCVSGGRKALPMSPVDRRRELEARRQESEDLRVNAAVQAAAEELLRRWGPRLDSVSAGEGSLHLSAAQQLCKKERTVWREIQPEFSWAGPIETLFKQWDRNGDQELEEDELERMFDSAGIKTSSSERRQCMHALESLRGELWRLDLPITQRYHWRGFNVPRQAQVAPSIPESTPLPGTTLPRGSFPMFRVCCAPPPIVVPPPPQFTSTLDPMHFRLPVPKAIDRSTFRSWLAPHPPSLPQLLERTLQRELKAQTSELSRCAGKPEKLRARQLAGNSAWVLLHAALRASGEQLDLAHFVSGCAFQVDELPGLQSLMRGFAQNGIVVDVKTAPKEASQATTDLDWAREQRFRWVLRGLHPVVRKAKQTYSAMMKAERELAADEDTDSGWGSDESERDDPVTARSRWSSGRKSTRRMVTRVSSGMPREHHIVAQSFDEILANMESLFESLAWRENPEMDVLLLTWPLLAERALTDGDACAVPCERLPRLFDAMGMCFTASQLDSLVLELAEMSQARELAKRAPPVAAKPKPPAPPPPRRPPKRVGIDEAPIERPAALSMSKRSLSRRLHETDVTEDPSKDMVAVHPTQFIEACVRRNRREVVLAEVDRVSEMRQELEERIASHALMRAAAQEAIARGEEVETPRSINYKLPVHPRAPSNSEAVWANAHTFDDPGSQDALALADAWRQSVSFPVFYQWYCKSLLANRVRWTRHLGKLREYLLDRAQIRAMLDPKQGGVLLLRFSIVRRLREEVIPRERVSFRLGDPTSSGMPADEEDRAQAEMQATRSQVAFGAENALSVAEARAANMSGYVSDAKSQAFQEARKRGLPLSGAPSYTCHRCSRGFACARDLHNHLASGACLCSDYLLHSAPYERGDGGVALQWDLELGKHLQGCLLGVGMQGLRLLRRALGDARRITSGLGVKSGTVSDGSTEALTRYHSDSLRHDATLTMTLADHVLFLEDSAKTLVAERRTLPKQVVGVPILAPHLWAVEFAPCIRADVAFGDKPESALPPQAPSYPPCAVFDPSAYSLVTSHKSRRRMEPMAETSESDESEVHAAMKPFQGGQGASTVSTLPKSIRREVRGTHGLSAAEKARVESQGAGVLLQLAEEWEETDDDEDDDMVVENGTVHALAGLEAAKRKQRALG
jgi:alpha-tubulin suppressor-like RCC1 family protein